MLKRSILLAPLIFGAAPVFAQEGSGEPSALTCNDFKNEAARVLAQSPDTLQINNLLFEAAHKGCVSALGALLGSGASLEARDRMGNNALSIAARMGRLAFAKALLDAQTPADRDQLDRANVAGSTPLIEAVQANRTVVAEMLLEAGAKVDAVNRQGETALSAAAFNGNAELARMLLARKAAPDTVDATGKGVIIYAAARGAAGVVEMLLDAGVDPNRRYHADLTALMWAAGHPDNVSDADALQTVKLLLSRGATIDFVDDRGMSALMIAASLDHAAIARALLEAGADRGLRDKNGKSAADLARGAEARAIVLAP
ncbi:MAG: ankyrin repeat domain-containing protein [Roseiarcus sp.]